ncbi:hypothetical protein Sps_00495 [Shewanella psychrophila]|uniref:Uncharacterized protein n=1 Tax=Shewanella psychrophila TaxID=225848 RepID=A0A1S6HJL0_9GAMM|nr:hypothetical protein Sps_00495 [Shewanella psychrophila]
MDALGPSQVCSERFNDVIKPPRINALNLPVDYLHGYDLALNNNQTKIELNIDMMSGPLNLYCITLENV